MPMTWFDAILIVLMFISGFLAMLRGFTREVLSIMSWALAAVATLYFLPMYKDKAAELIQPEMLAMVILAGGIFVSVLVIVSLVTARLSDRVLDSRVGALDRTLGFVFGLGRGLILVVIAYLLFSWLVQKENQPQWIQEARSLSLIESTGEVILSLLPENPADVIKDFDKGIEEKLQEDKKSSINGDSNFANAATRDYASGVPHNLNQLLKNSVD